MKHTYITLQTMFTCLSKPVAKKDIHAELEKTIAERKRIMKQMEDFSRKGRMIEVYPDNARAA
jgi:hypothetical protein